MTGCSTPCARIESASSSSDSTSHLRPAARLVRIDVDRCQSTDRALRGHRACAQPAPAAPRSRPARARRRSAHVPGNRRRRGSLRLRRPRAQDSEIAGAPGASCRQAEVPAKATPARAPEPAACHARARPRRSRSFLSRMRARRRSAACAPRPLLRRRLIRRNCHCCFQVPSSNCSCLLTNCHPERSEAPAERSRRTPRSQQHLAGLRHHFHHERVPQKLLTASAIAHTAKLIGNNRSITELNIDSYQSQASSANVLDRSLRAPSRPPKIAGSSTLAIPRSTAVLRRWCNRACGLRRHSTCDSATSLCDGHRSSRSLPGPPRLLRRLAPPPPGQSNAR